MTPPATGSSGAPEDDTGRAAGPDTPTAATPVDVVRGIQEALGRGDLMAPMAHLARDVVWRQSVTRRDAAPWFAEYRGRQGVLAFFEALSQVQMREFTIRAVVGDEHVVMAWLRVAWTAPSGREVDMDEVQIWRFEGAKVVAVDLVSDTLAVADAFAG